MANKTSLLASQAGLLTALALLVSLTGCMVEGQGRRGSYRTQPVVRVQAGIVFQDDYDYYPAYETYYSRNRHEYVYRDGNSWVRRSAPLGISASVLLAAPSVRLDFHDSPEQHHGAVVKSYPKNWKHPGNAPSAKDDRRHGKKDDKKDDRKDNDRRGD